MRTRQKPRKALTVPGRFFTGLGEPVDVKLADLSEGGCRFSAGDRTLPIGSHVQIYIAGSGPHHASVTWSDKGEVGVTFAKPLESDQLRRFQNTHVPDLSVDSSQRDFEPMPDTPPRRFC